MLLRAYRVTDKLGIALLKSSVALIDTTQVGTGIMVSAVRRVLVGGVFAVLLSIGYVIYRILRRIVLAVWSVLRVILGVLGAGGLFAVNVTRRMTGQAAYSAGSSASGAMARRAARAEMEAGLAEDPLRAQNRVLSGLAVLLLATLIAVVLWATGPGRSSNPGVPSVSNQNLSIFDSTPGTVVASPPVALVASPIPTATTLPSVLEVRGSLAYVVREKAQSDIWVVGVGTRTPLRLTNDPADDRDPAWSPDGTQLAFASHRDGNWEIHVYDMETRETTRMTYDLSFQGGPQWSPDGQWLVYESYQGNNLDIYTVPVNDPSQAPIRITDNPAPDFSPAWSPDGRHIAFVSWRDGNQDIYIFSLDDPRDAASVNVTNTPTRQEDYPAWDPAGEMLAYSALDEGLEKVFVKPANDPEAIAQVMERGRTPAWAPDGASLVFAVDSVDSTHLVAAPFAAEGVATEVIPVPLGATDPTWTSAPLPAALVNAGGVGAAVPGPLFIEQEARLDADPPFRLSPLPNVDAPYAVLSERVDDSFNALRTQTNDDVGWDFFGTLEDAFWDITRPPQPGEERRNWHMTGRAIAFNRNSIVGFPPPIEIVREDIGVYTYWQVYVRVSDEAQSGNLGEPLRRMPWDFASRSEGDVAAYDEGGRLRTQMPAGYYIDLTQLAQDFGWSRVPAGSDWRANFNSTNYWLFDRQDGLSWYDAMRELYTVPQLGGFAPDATAIPIQQPTAEPGG